MLEILILSSGRNGSNFLLSQLAASQEIYPLGEIYKPGANDVELNYFLAKKANEALGYEDQNYLDKTVETALHAQSVNPIKSIINAAALGPNPKMGIVSKLFVEHISYKFATDMRCARILRSHLDGPTKTILLYRNRLLDVFASTQRAVSENRWITAKFDNITLQIGLEEYLNWRDWYVRTWILSLEIIHELSSSIANLNLLTVAYEDLCKLELPATASLLSKFIFEAEPSSTWLTHIRDEVTTRQSSGNHGIILPFWSQEYKDDSFRERVDMHSPHLLYLLERTKS